MDKTALLPLFILSNSQIKKQNSKNNIRGFFVPYYLHNTKCKNSDNCYKGEKPNDAKKSEQQKRKGTKTKGDKWKFGGRIQDMKVLMA